MKHKNQKSINKRNMLKNIKKKSNINQLKDITNLENKGLISDDRKNKLTLHLTIPCFSLSRIQRI